MADGQQKNDPGKDKLSYKSEKPSETGETSDSRKARAEIAREAREFQGKEAKTQRAKVAIEVTGKKSVETIEMAQLKVEQFRDSVNSPEFDKLDVRESAEKQESLLYSLAGTAIFELLPYLLNEKKVSVQKIKNFDFFEKPPFADAKDYFNTDNPQGSIDLLSAFEKIREIGGSNEKRTDGKMSVKEVWMKNWEEMVERAKDAAPMMEHFQKHPDALKTGELPSEKKSFFEEHSTAVKVGAIGLGVVAAAYLTSDWWGQSAEDKAKESSSMASTFFGKLFKLIGSVGLLAGVGFGLGRLTEVEIVRKWLKTLNIDDSAVIEALRLYSHGRFQEAIDRLGEAFGESRYEQGYKTIADRVNASVPGSSVKPETIEKIKDLRYQELFPQDLLGKGEKAIGDFFKSAGGHLPLVGDYIKQDPQIEQELHYIALFLVLPENQEKMKRIAPGPKITMRQLLFALCDLQLPQIQTPGVIPEAAVVIPMGEKGREAQIEGRKTQSQIDASQHEVLALLKPNQKLDVKLKEKLESEGKSYKKLLDSIENSEKSWAASWTEGWRKLFRAVPNTSYDDQDLTQLADQLQEENGIILQDLRTQFANLMGDIQKAFQDGKPLTTEEVENLRQQIQGFYNNYGKIQAKLDEVNQQRIKEQEELNRLLSSDDTASKVQYLKDGLELTYTTLWGIPVSVLLKREDNGRIVRYIGYASAITGTIGLAQGLWKGKSLTGKFVRGTAEGMWGLTKPVRFITYEGLFLSKRGIEYWVYLKRNSALRAVQRGEKTVPQAMDTMQKYLEGYGYKWNGVDIKKMEGSSFLDKAGKYVQIRKKELSKGQINALEENLKVLEELKKAKCDTWAQGVAKGIVEDFIKSKFAKSEEALIAEKMKEIMEEQKKNPPAGGKNLEGNLLREKAIEDLQKEGKLKSVKDMGDSVRELGSEKSLEKLGSHGEKIEALREAGKEADLYLEKSLIEMRQMQLAGKDQKEIEIFAKGVQENLKGARSNFQKSLGELEAAKGLTRAESKNLAVLLKDLEKGKGIRVMLKRAAWDAVKHRMVVGVVLGVATMAVGMYQANEKDKQKHIERSLWELCKEAGPEGIQMAGDLLAPFGATDWYAVAEGKEWYTGKEVKGDDKIRHIVFGTFSAVSDVAAIVAACFTAGAGGVAVYGGERSVAAAARYGSKAAKFEKFIPRLMVLAKEAGGVQKLLEILKSERFLKSLKALKYASGAGVAYYTAQDLKPLVFAGYEYVFSAKGQPEHQLTLEEKDYHDLVPADSARDKALQTQPANDDAKKNQTVDESPSEFGEAA